MLHSKHAPLKTRFILRKVIRLHLFFQLAKGFRQQCLLRTKPGTFTSVAKDIYGTHLRNKSYIPFPLPFPSCFSLLGDQGLWRAPKAVYRAIKTHVKLFSI